MKQYEDELERQQKDREQEQAQSDNASAEAIADNDARIEAEHQQELQDLLLTPEQIEELIKETGWGTKRAESLNLPSNYLTVAQAQLSHAEPLIRKDERERMGNRGMIEVLTQLKSRILLSQACLADEIHDMGGGKKVPYLTKKQKFWDRTVARIEKLLIQTKTEWQSLKGGEL